MLSSLEDGIGVASLVGAVIEGSLERVVLEAALANWRQAAVCVITHAQTKEQLQQLLRENCSDEQIDTFFVFF